MRTGIIFTLLIFGSGLIFGYGMNMAFTKDAVRAAYGMGQESVVLTALENGKIEVADAQ
jgi:hypothetical protein